MEFRNQTGLGPEGSRPLRGGSCVMGSLVLRALVLVAAAAWTMSAQAADMNYGSRAPNTVNQPLNAYSWARPKLGGNHG